MQIGVVGAGTMGGGIVEVALLAGDAIVWFDTQAAQMQTAKEFVAKRLAKKDQESKISNLALAQTWEEFRNCELVVEAVFEDLGVKHDVFKKLDDLVPAPNVLASNTSSILITEIAKACQRPERVVGMHFFNPVPIMQLVEVIRAQKTDDRTLDLALSTARHFKKTPIPVLDRPGFVANRILRPFYVEGLFILEEEKVTPSVIDNAVRELGKFRMGPLELADLVGLDVNFNITKVLFRDFGQMERFRPSQIQETLVQQGKLGRKTKEGFYLYGQEGKKIGNGSFFASGYRTACTRDEQKAIFLRIMAMVINEAFLMLEEGVAKQKDIDTVMRLGGNWPKGPFEWFESLGPGQILTMLEQLNKRNPKRYAICPKLYSLA